MKTSWSWLSLVALSLVACQPPPPSWEPGHASVPNLSSASHESESAKVSKDRKAEVIGVEAKVTRLSGEVVAASKGRMAADGVFSFETTRQGESASSELVLHLEPARREGFTAAVSWRETTPEGRIVKWSPTVAIADGVEAVTEITWSDGDGRRLSLKLSRGAPAEQPAAPPAEAPVVRADPPTAAGSPGAAAP